LNRLLRIIDGAVIDELAGHHLHVAWQVEDWLQSPRSRLRIPTLRDNHLLEFGFVGGIGGIRDCAAKHEGSGKRQPKQNARNGAQAQRSHSSPLDLLVRGRCRWMRATVGSIPGVVALEQKTSRPPDAFGRGCYLCLGPPVSE